MTVLTLDGRSIELDKDGYLADLNDWSPEVATALAVQNDIELTPDHWEILQLLRNFYEEFQLSPATRPLIKYTALKLGAEKGNSLHLNRLFNGTPAKLAAKLAGPNRPTAYEHPCSADANHSRRTPFRSIRTHFGQR